MLLIDSDDRVCYATAAVQEMFEDRDDVVGRSLTAMIDDRDVATVREALDAVRHESGVESRCCSCRLRSDRVIEIEFVSMADPTASGTVLAVVRDESAPETRARLATAQDRFGHLFDLIQDAVVELEIVDGEPIARTINAAFEDVFGYDADDVRDSSLNEYVVPDDHDEEAVDFDQRTADGKANYAVVTRQTARGRREFLYRGIPYDRPDGRQFGFAIYSDISDQKRAREHLRVLHRVLRHNLRNEMTVVRGMGERIEAATDDPATAEAAARIVDCADRLTTVSQKASTAADVVGDPAPDTVVDAATQARTVVAAYRDRWPDAAIETDLPETVPVTAQPKLSRALSNLVENALEHNEGERVVRVSARTGADESSIVVADNGPGIPPSERAAIFGNEDITQLQHGSGLGLWLVKWVVESAGGRIGYEHVDGWTRIRLTLPTATVAHPA